MMRKILVITVVAMGLFGFGFVSQAVADSNTGSQYKTYCDTQKKISKLQVKLGETEDPTKAAKIQTKIDKLTAKAVNIKPVVGGLGAYQKDSKKLDKLNAGAANELATYGHVNESLQARIDKVTAKVDKDATKAASNEQKQYDKLSARIDKAENKASITGKQGAANRVEYLKGQQDWLASKTNSILEK
jgi:hypothetical protein